MLNSGSNFNYLKPSKYNNNKNCFYTAAAADVKTAAAAGVQCGRSGWTERERNKKMLKVYLIKVLLNFTTASSSSIQWHSNGYSYSLEAR